MKPKSEVFAICDYASVDREGKLSVMGIFREIFADKMPAYIAHFYIAATIVGEAEKAYDIKISFTSPNGEETIPVQEASVQIGIGGVTNLVTDVVNLPLEQSGEYIIKLTTNDDYVVGTSLFRVIDLKTKQPSSN